MIRKSVSVILPTNKVDLFLGEALQSILTDMSEFDELVIVTNGDAIKHHASLQEQFFEDHRVVLAKSESPGIVAALNLGLHIAKNEYVARMDSDDISLKGRLDAQVRYLETHPNVACIGTQMIYICQHGQEIRRTLFKLNLGPTKNKPLVPIVGHPTVMFRKSVIQKLGNYSNTYGHVEDHDLWTRLLENHKIANLKTSYLKYRLHNNQVSRLNSLSQARNALSVLLHDSLTYGNSLTETERLRIVEELLNLESGRNYNLLGRIPKDRRRHLKKLIRNFEITELLKGWSDTGGLKTYFLRPTSQQKRLLLALLSSAFSVGKLLIRRLILSLYWWACDNRHCNQCQKNP